MGSQASLHTSSGAIIQLVHIALCTNLHGPAGACIPVASATQIHIFQFNVCLRIQTNIIQMNMILIKNLRTPKLVGIAKRIACTLLYIELIMRMTYLLPICHRICTCDMHKQALQYHYTEFI